MRKPLEMASGWNSFGHELSEALVRPQTVPLATRISGQSAELYRGSRSLCWILPTVTDCDVA